LRCAKVIPRSSSASTRSNSSLSTGPIYSRLWSILDQNYCETSDPRNSRPLGRGPGRRSVGGRHWDGATSSREQS
jgi:hypothetical protein